MNQFKLNLYWRVNKTAVRRGLALLGIGCIGTSEKETITTLRGVWIRTTGTRYWHQLKPFVGNL